MEEKLPSSSSKPSRTPSARRLNANSLLNFRFSPLEQQQPRRQRRTKVRAFNKFHYVKAQFRFMLSSGREHLSLSAVDKRVDWDRVELVEFPVDKVVQCPICMSEPVAPRLTKCGHVYCFHCILNYLSRSPFNYSRCPLCFESIYLADLKPLTFFLRLKHRVGDKVRFSLIRRRKDSVLCTPVDADDFSDSCSSFGFSSIQIGRDIAFNLEKDHRQLSTALSDAEASEAPFILEALRIVEELLVHSSSRSASLEADAATTREDPCDDDETFLFYQSHNGERLFLDSLCYRCLLAEFKDPDHLPGSFQAEIVSLTPLQQNKALRSKFRFLSHLTLTTSFEVCEVRMDDLVSRQNLKPFRAEFSKRFRARKKQQKIQERVDLAAKAKRDLANVRRVTSELQLMPSVSPSANPFRLNVLDDPVPGGASGSSSSSSVLPQPTAVPAPSTWSLIADRGLASSTAWAPLPAAAAAAATGPTLSRQAAPASQPRWPNAAAAAAAVATVVAPVNPRSRKGKRTLFSNVAQRRPR